MKVAIKNQEEKESNKVTITCQNCLDFESSKSKSLSKSLNNSKSDNQNLRYQPRTDPLGRTRKGKNSIGCCKNNCSDYLIKNYPFLPLSICEKYQNSNEKFSYEKWYLLQ